MDGPPPPPPMGDGGPALPVAMLAQAEKTKGKEVGGLNGQLSKKRDVAEAEADLTPEQLAAFEGDLPKWTCPRCEQVVVAAFQDDHHNSHSAEILSFLYLGGERNAHNKKELTTRTGITDILNVAEEVDNTFAACRVDCPCTNGGLECNGRGLTAPEPPFMFTYHTHRIKDQKDEPITDVMNTALDIIENIRTASPPRRVLVHCVAGISRSASVVIAYLMRHKRITLRAAFDFVRQRRSIVSPIADFIVKLQEYEKYLHDQSPLDGYTGSPSLTLQDVYPEGTRFISNRT